jgi:hypothetical protein
VGSSSLGLEAVILFALLMIATGVLNAVGQNLWAWLRCRLTRRQDRA